MGALKIVLLGDSAVGKSSLLHRFTTDTFDAHLPNTIGAAFVLAEHSVQGRTAKLEIWDTAGQERYRSLTPMYYRNGKVALVCFDMSNAKTSFEKARYWLEQLKLLGPLDIMIKLVGTKFDLHAGRQDPEGATSGADGTQTSEDVLDQNEDVGLEIAEIERYCTEHEVPLYRTSAKANIGILQIFDDIVSGLDDDFFQEEPPQISLQERRPQSSCC